MHRQKLGGEASEYYTGYRTEIEHMLDKWLTLLSDEEAERVRCAHLPY